VPELPEVETARRLIADRALHRRIIAVDDADTNASRPHPPALPVNRLQREDIDGTVGGRSTWWCSREQAAWPDAA
jgi:formamidopyrimidine-DNA glycosylase